MRSVGDQHPLNVKHNIRSLAIRLQKSGSSTRDDSLESIVITPRFRCNLALHESVDLPGWATVIEYQWVELQTDTLKGWGWSSMQAGDWYMLSLVDIERHAPWILNENARHFLRHARPRLLKGTLRRLEGFKSFIASHGYRSSEVVLDSSMLLESYGLRRAGDIDYLLMARRGVSEGDIESHDLQLVYHGISKQNLIQNPENYFEYHGVKIIGFSQVARFKRNRDTLKDRIDLAMMKEVEKEFSIKLLWYHIQLAIWKMGVKARKLVINILKSAGFYISVRNLFHRMFNR